MFLKPILLNHQVFYCDLRIGKDEYSGKDNR